MVRENASAAGLLAALRYEGTPGLWHWMLWCLGRVAPLTPGTACLLYSAVLLALLGVILFWLPAPFWARCALLLQVPLFWYADNVRQYALAALLLLGWGCLRSGRIPRSPWMEAACVALIGQTSLHGLLAMLCIGLFEILQPGGPGFRRRAIFLGGLVLSLGLALLQLWPPADLMPGLAAWNPAGKTFLGSAEGVLWDACFGDSLLVPAVIVAAGLVLWPRERREVPWVLGMVAALLLCLGLFAVVAWLKYAYARHHWTLSFLMVAFLCIAAGVPGRPSRWRRVARIGWPCLAVISAIIAFRSLPAHWSTPKSSGRDLAAYLDREYPDSPVLAMSEEFEAAARVYRKHPVPVYALGRQAFVGWTVWNHPSVDYRAHPESHRILISRVIAATAAAPPPILARRPVVVVSGTEVLWDVSVTAESIPVGDAHRMRLLRHFRGSAWEDFSVFALEISPRRDDAAVQSPPASAVAPASSQSDSSR